MDHTGATLIGLPEFFKTPIDASLYFLIPTAVLSKYLVHCGGNKRRS
jgi:hypothetical protein